MKGDFHQTKGTDGFYRIAAEGEKGNPGESGASAYEIWLSLGNKGTEEDFIKSLKGEKGDKGVDGVSGKWGDITGDISSQKDLQEALAGKADVATTLGGYGITDTYTKTEIDAKVSRVYHYKGTVSAYADLPSSGQEVGDVWNIETADSAHGIKAGDNVAWTGIAWDSLSGIVDLTPFATKDELSVGLEGKSDINHLHTGKYVPLNENGQVVGSYVVAGSWTFGEHLSANGFVNAREGFKKNGVNLDDIYAAKSHTHVSSDITDLQTGGGVEEFSDASREWTAVDVGKIFKYTGETTGRFVNGRLYAGIGYKVMVSGGGTTYVLERTSGSDSHVAGAIGTYSLISGTEGSTDAVYKNGNGWIIYFNTANYRWALSSDSSSKIREDFINMTGIEGDKWTSWDYECNDSIFVTKVPGGSSTEQDAYTASLLDICPAIEEKLSGANVTIYPGRRYAITLSEATTLNADGGLDGLRGECEIDITTGDYSIVAGTNISLVDSLFAKVVNRCVVRWDGTSAKLYVWEAR